MGDKQGCDKPSSNSDGRPFGRILSTQEIEWGQILEGTKNQFNNQILLELGAIMDLSRGACLEKLWGNLT